MNALARIPFTVWYLFSVAYCYLIWNPWGFSLWGLMESNADLPLKFVAGVVAIIIAAMYVAEGHRSMNTLGVVLFCSLFGGLMWLAFNNGFRGFGSVHVWGQWVVGLLMAIALQGGRVYRSMTGRVPVGGVVDHDGGHHG